MAAGEAIAVICEVQFLEKFSSNTTVDKISSNEKGKNLLNQDSSLQELQEIISNHAKRLLRQTSLQSAATNTVNQWNNFSMDVLEVLKVNFIKRFLGCGFTSHMLENEFLQDVFNFIPRKQISVDELYSCEREEVIV